MSQPGPAASASTEQTLDLRDYIAPVWQRKWLILLLVVLAAGGAYALATRQRSADLKHRVYEASTQVYIEVASPTELIGSGPGAAATPPDGQQMSDLATLFTEQSITQAVSRALGMPAASAGSVSASLLDTGSAATYGSSIIVVTATSSSGPLAARLANTYVAQFLASRKQAEASAASAQASAINAQLVTLPKSSATAAERQTLRLQIVALRAIVSNPQAGAYQISPAPAPGAPLPVGSSRTPIVDAVIAGVVALLLGIGLAFASSLFDRRLRRVSNIETSYRLPVLGVLPHVSRISRVVDGHAIVPPEFVETFRSLRVTLRLLGDGAAMRSLVVTSALPGEGKSTVAAHLALACVEGGERVLLVDADLRRPSVATWFRVQPPAGLLQVLRGEASLADAIVPLHGAAPTAHNGNGNGNGNGGGGATGATTPVDGQGDGRPGRPPPAP
jgi:capsular polysaccharide biosynthesis protein